MGDWNGAFIVTDRHSERGIILNYTSHPCKIQIVYCSVVLPLGLHFHQFEGQTPIPKGCLMI